jgi:cytochrome c oxidase cbb3-type subunit 4
MNGNELEIWRMDLNLIRSIVTVLAFVVFIAMVLRVWRAANREQYAEAAALPFADEQEVEPGSARHATGSAAK